MNGKSEGFINCYEGRGYGNGIINLRKYCIP